MTIRSQDSVQFPQNSVRIIVSLQYVRQQDDIDRIILYPEAVFRHDQVSCIFCLIPDDRGSFGTSKLPEFIAPPNSNL